MATPEQLAELDQLAELVARAQRREEDLAEVSLAVLSRRLMDEVEGLGDEVDLRWAAESLQQLTRLLELKMGRRLDETSDEFLAAPAPVETDLDPTARLEEYRIFKAAAGVLLADASAGPKAFLRVLGLPVEPQAALHLSPEALASAFGEVLARLPEIDELRITMPRYSVEEKVKDLRHRLDLQGRLQFDQIFLAARDRMEAVAIFLALLELVWSGEASCSQQGVDRPILVERVHGG